MRNKRTTLNCLRNSHFDPSHFVRSFVRSFVDSFVYTAHKQYKAFKEDQQTTATTNNSNNNNNDDDDGDDNDENTGIVTMPETLETLCSIQFNRENIKRISWFLSASLSPSLPGSVCAVCVRLLSHSMAFSFLTSNHFVNICFFSLPLSHFAHSFPIQIFFHIVVHARTHQESERYLNCERDPYKHRIGCEAIDLKRMKKKICCIKSAWHIFSLAVILGRRLLSFSLSVCVCVCVFLCGCFENLSLEIRFVFIFDYMHTVGRVFSFFCLLISSSILFSLYFFSLGFHSLELSIS